MRKLIFFGALFCTLSSYGQNEINIDSVGLAICETITNNQKESDSLTVVNSLVSHSKIFERFVTESDAETFFYNLHIRMQALCPEYQKIILRNTPKKGDWELIDKMPIPKVSKKDCEDLFKHSELIYLESSGDSTRVKLTNSNWIDSFPDRTSSKLTIKKLTDCEFILTFIESNNKIRKQLSNPGDQYKYTILEKHSSYYLMAVEITGIKQISTFKLYF